MRGLTAAQARWRTQVRRAAAMRLAALAFAAAAITSAAPARADVKGLYDPADLEKEAPRLRSAVTRIYEGGVKPFLTPDERTKLGDFDLRFPLPSANDAPLDFYADQDRGKPIVVMPVLSLRLLEDMATAYAWLHRKGMSLGTLELYFSMLRHKPRANFPGGRYPPILATLGIPADALDDKLVDANSLAFRNQAFAFILVHELGHILYRHKGYAEISKAEARADEVASDRFALDVLSRTQTPPLGALFFFQAQLYNLPHRGEFPDRRAWEQYLLKSSTHPLTVDRIAAMADYIDGPLARGRVKEAALWRSITADLRKIVREMEDESLQRCMAQVAATADLSLLKPRRDVPWLQYVRLCQARR
jgi:hypothetical protein